MMSGQPKEKMSINWNLENDFSSLVRQPPSDQIITSTGGRGKVQSFSLRTRNRDHMIQPTNSNMNVMSNIPEMANESRVSENFSQGGYFLFDVYFAFGVLGLSGSVRKIPCWGKHARGQDDETDARGAKG